MKTMILVGALSSLIGLSNAMAADHDPSHIIPLMKDAKMSLVEGIEYAEKVSGVSTSAKFEIASNGKLMLSVYTIPEGLGVEPEKATLTEVSGDVTQAPFQPQIDVFADKEHIARATVHMTLFQLSKLSLKDVVARALQCEKGTPIDVRNPMVRKGRPVADVILFDDSLAVRTVTVDLLTGSAQSGRP
jgi:hypothetical protein